MTRHRCARRPREARVTKKSRDAEDDWCLDRGGLMGEAQALTIAALPTGLLPALEWMGGNRRARLGDPVDASRGGARSA
jgi:hypothetical protein